MSPDGVDARHGSAPAPATRRRIGLFAAVALVVIALDAISKAVVVARLSGHAPVRILAGALYLDEERNSGAAFSVGTGATVVLTVIAVVVAAVIVRTARRMHSVGWAISLGLILGGALGNLADRLFRAPGFARGHVVDWLSLFGPYGAHWPVFNLADSAIVCGAILAAILAVFGIDLGGHSGGDPATRAGETGGPGDPGAGARNDMTGPRPDA